MCSSLAGHIETLTPISSTKNTEDKRLGFEVFCDKQILLTLDFRQSAAL